MQNYSSFNYCVKILSNYLEMLTRQLRRSKRTASPSIHNGEAEKPKGPPSKKLKKPAAAAVVDLSESDSSSEELASLSIKPNAVVDLSESDSSSAESEPPVKVPKASTSRAVLTKVPASEPEPPVKVPKASTSRAVLTKVPASEPDFSSIEKSIFSGVSTLSDSDESSDSDFQEVSNTASSSSLMKNSDLSLVDTKNVSEESTVDTNIIPHKSSNEDVKGKSTAKARADARATAIKCKKKDNEVPLSKTKHCAADGIDARKGRRTRNSKKEPPLDTNVSSKRNVKSAGKFAVHSETLELKPSTSSVKGKGKKSINDVKGGKETLKSTGSRKSKVMKDDNSLKEEVPDSVDNLDIAQLLALGEGIGEKVKSPEPSDSESDEWEEVNTTDIKKHEIPKDGVQITLDMPEFSWRRKKQRDEQACLQAEMNRAFNRVRKELQLLCHKASLLSWLAHGIFLNRVINSDSLKALALSLVPNDLSTSPKLPGKKYIDQLLKWFSKEFECSEGFPEHLDISQAPPLLSVLEQHFSRRFAKSTKELTFMFVTTLRSVGLECRLIISFQPMPLKPQSDELLAINRRTDKTKKGRPSKRDSTDHEKSVKKSESPCKITKSSDKDSSESMASPSAKSVSKKVNESNAKNVVSESNSKSKQKSASSPRGPSKKVTITKKEAQLSEPSTKTRVLRRKSATKTYREETDSENNKSADDSQPILSPDKKKSIDKSSVERLKAAAAKRLPAKCRSRAKSTANPGPSKAKKSLSQDSDSDSDFEILPKPVKQGKEVANNTSPYFSKSTASDSELSDSDFESKPKRSTKKASRVTPTKRQQAKAGSSKRKGIGMKVLSSDDDSSKKQLTTSGSDYWVEVYLKDEDRWVCVDIPSKKVDSSNGILARATQPVCYVIAFNNEETVKDVTKRYSPKFSQVTVKLRVSSEWWEKSLKPFRPKRNQREVQEDSEMNLVELDRPMPKSVGECKNHPLYVLKRHLLKFEAIYPPDAPSLGFVRNEAIYARQNVYTLHSREIWIKEAKVVRAGEQPYKIVKARPKYDRLSGKTLTDLPLEVFGPWQVEDYVPPPAVDGKVPRNAYGNVELFKPTMLPKGCVHLQVPGLSRVAKKLRIDCAPAVVGFDYHSGGSHPTFDGFVVCEENVDVLLDAWNRDIDESAKRREEKHEKRVYGNWRRLIKGLLIREQLKYRYDFNGENEEAQGSGQSSVNSALLKAS